MVARLFGLARDGSVLLGADSGLKQDVPAEENSMSPCGLPFRIGNTVPTFSRKLRLMREGSLSSRSETNEP